MRLILASASPRRKELLKEVAQDFEIFPALGEETAVADSPALLAQSLARAKAEEVFARLADPDVVALGADTVVAYEGRIFGKPRSKQEAEEMLSMLSGREHKVITGVCILYEKRGEKRTLVDFDETAVRFERLSPSFIRAYVEGGSPMDKAGAYGIQDGGLVKEIEGSYSNVVGLPVELCKKMFARARKDIEND